MSMKRLLIFAKPFADKVDWYYYPTNHQCVEKGLAVPIASIPAQYRTASIKKCLVLLGADILICPLDTTLKLSRAKLHQALPALLEESLIPGSNEQSYAIYLDRNTKQNYALVIQQSVLHDISNYFESKGLMIDQICPLNLILPDINHKGCMLAYEDNLYINMPGQKGIILNGDQLSALESVLQERFSPESTLVYVPQMDPGLPVFKHIETKTTTYRDFSEIPWDLDSIHPVVFTGTQQAKVTNGDQTFFKHISIIVGLFICVVFIKQLYIYHQLSDNLEDLALKSQSIFQTFYPNANADIDPRTRIESDLKRLSKHGGQSKFLDILDLIKPVLVNQRNVSIEQMNFQNNQMTLQLTADTATNIENISQKINQTKVTATIKNMAAQDEKVKAMLVIQ